MKHPKEEIWSDYVRGTADPSTVRALEEHLGTGCSKCSQQVSALESVLRVSRTDRALEVPAAALRAARSIFRIQRLLEQQSTPRRTLAIAFDSLLTPATSGVRDAGTQARHLVYESGDLTVDLQVEPETDSRAVRMVGQVCDSSANPLAEVPAFLHQGGRVSSQDVTGPMGNFNLRTSTTGASRLCFVVGDEELVEMELPALANESASTDKD